MQLDLLNALGPLLSGLCHDGKTQGVSARGQSALTQLIHACNSGELLLVVVPAHLPTLPPLIPASQFLLCVKSWVNHSDNITALCWKMDKHRFKADWELSS